MRTFSVRLASMLGSAIALCAISGFAQRCFLSIGCDTGSVMGFVSGDAFEAVVTRENCAGAGGGTVEIQRE